MMCVRLTCPPAGRRLHIALGDFGEGVQLSDQRQSFLFAQSLHLGVTSVVKECSWTSLVFGGGCQFDVLTFGSMTSASLRACWDW